MTLQELSEQVVGAFDRLLESQGQVMEKDTCENGSHIGTDVRNSFKEDIETVMKNALGSEKTAYSHDLSAMCIDVFERELIWKNENELGKEHQIVLTSPEDSEKEDDNSAVLYGSTYDSLLAEVEQLVIGFLSGQEKGFVTGIFSGDC